MKRNMYRRLVLLTLVCCIFFLGGILLQGTNTMAGQTKSTKKEDHLAAFKIYQQKCLGCHDSVADPEKLGRTRDDWFLIINTMHDYGFDLTDEQSEQIIDLLYELRHGLEREAG